MLIYYTTFKYVVKVTMLWMIVVFIYSKNENICKKSMLSIINIINIFFINKKLMNNDE